MQSLPYSSLTDEQRAQVAYLFADDIFGSDAGAFVYEVNGDEVVGRRLQGEGQTATRAKQALKVTVHMQEVTVSDELLDHARMSMDALAASIAAKMYQSTRKLEEVKA